MIFGRVLIRVLVNWGYDGYGYDGFGWERVRKIL